MKTCNPKSNVSGCAVCLIKKYSLIGDLPFHELIHLDTARYKISYQANEYIFKEGSTPIGLIALNKGKVKITRKGTLAKEVIVNLKKPVDFLGLNDLMINEPHTTSAIALEDTSVCIIKKENFFDILDKNKEFSKTIINHLVKEISNIQLRSINLTQKHMRGRMAEAILLVQDQFGTIDNGIINVDLKRSDYASLANMTTANAIRVFSSFKKEGLIKINKRKIIILNKEDLLKISCLG